MHVLAGAGYHARSVRLRRNTSRRTSAIHTSKGGEVMGSAVLGEAIGAIRDVVGEGRKRLGERAARDRDVRQPGVQRRGAAGAAAEAGVSGAAADDHAWRSSRRGGRRRGGEGDEGMGRRTRRHALHALVPAADRHHRRKARLVSDADGQRQGRRRIQRQRADQGRARRARASRPAACGPPSKRAATRRGIRRARPGCSTAAAR